MTDDAMIAWREGLRYRILYGFARRFLEGAGRSDNACEGASKVQVDDLLDEVLRIAPVDRETAAEMELARDAIEDATAGREPRW